MERVDQTPALPGRDRWVVTLVVLALVALILGFAASAPAFDATGTEASEPGPMGNEGVALPEALTSGATDERVLIDSDGFCEPFRAARTGREGGL